LGQQRRPVREQLRDVRARHILAVAQELLIEKGYRDASMDEIAARAGIAKGTLYQHFPHKEDLVLALFEQHLARFELAVDRAAGAAVPARARLEQILRHVYQDEEGAYAMLHLLTHNVEIRRSLAPGKGRALERLERATSQIEGILEDGKTDGSLEPGISTGLMLSAFVNALTLGRPGRRLTLDRLSREELAAQICRVLFDGIVRRQSPEG
jgi:AcrR family transcriptional regulator